MKRTRNAFFIVAGIFLILGVGVAFTVVGSFHSSPSHRPLIAPSNIELQGFDLCSANCVYPSPHLSGLVIFNGTAALKSLQLQVNGTDEGVRQWNGTSLIAFALDYKGGFTYPPVVKGDAYTIKFVAVFKDNSTATAETTIIAD